jgi:uncharacterized MAPEG superfamily protein
MAYVPYLAILAAYALIYLPRLLVVGRAMQAMPGGYDNADPRAQQQQLTGAGKRALNAHHNAIEAFPPFAAGVLAAAFRLPASWAPVLAVMCVAFVAARTAYLFAYIKDKPSLRSSLWGLGVMVTSALLVFAVIGPKL